MSLKTLRSALAGCCALMITITLAAGPAAAQPTSTKSTSLLPIASGTTTIHRGSLTLLETSPGER
jgi:hypothetical protein